MSEEKDKDQDVVEERYRVEVMLVIEKINGVNQTAHSDFHDSFSDVDLGTVVGIEHMMLAFQNKLGEVGIKVAVRKGFSEKLKLFGIDPDPIRNTVRESVAGPYPS